MDLLLNRLWRINIVFCAGIAVTTLYELPGITSMLFYASFMITAICMWICCSGKITQYLAGTVYVLIFIILFGIISVAQGHLSFDYLKKFIIYIATLISFFVSVRMNVSKGTVKVLLTSNVIVSVLYVVRAQADGAYIQETLWLFFSNPNFAGMWLFMSLMLLLVAAMYASKKLIKCTLVALAICLGYLCFQTGARNVWFSIGYAVVLSGVCLLSKTTRFKKRFIFAICIFPLIFALAYMFVISNGLFTESISDALVSEGKPITSRFAIWRNAFEYIGSYPLFGAYSVIGRGSGSFQLHNTHIDMWAAYGTVGLVLFLVYIYRIMKEVNDSCNTKGAMFALAGFMCMTLMGTAEASLYATGMGMYIFVSSFLLLANYMNRREKNENRISLN